MICPVKGAFSLSSVTRSQQSLRIDATFNFWELFLQLKVVLKSDEYMIHELPVLLHQGLEDIWFPNFWDPTGEQNTSDIQTLKEAE